jgi:hypothetical protein
MMKFIKGRKRAIVASGAVILLGATAAFAFFATTGAGTGSAQTGKLAHDLSITQVGAGYSSLISSNSPDPYIQDQCFACASISEFGNDITLAKTGAQQLVSVQVAMRNWGGAITNLPMTFSINNTVDGPISDTENFSFPAASGPDTPSASTITFNFKTQAAFVDQEFVYGITFDPNFDLGAAGGLNVALASSANNLSVGTDTVPGTVYVNTTAGPGIAGDFPACTTPGVGFAQVTTNCGPASASNTGAYGTTAQVQSGNADIPAVQVNVVGGVVPSLYPGGPSQPIDFAITNPNSSSVFVNSVTTSITTLSNTGSNGGLEACATSMYAVSPTTTGTVGNVPQGTTIYSPSGVSISMTDDGHNQNNCQGAIVNLSFTSN